MQYDEIFDIAIVGGGVIGLACAWRLAKTDATVALFERGKTGQEASWAAGGMLAAQCEAAHFSADGAPDAHAAMFELCLLSRGLYPEFLQELQHDSGLEVEASLAGLASSDWRRPGILFVAETDDDPGLQALARQKLAGHAVIRENHRGLPAAWLPDEGQVENRDLVAALKAACIRRGVRLFENSPVGSIRSEGSGEFTLQIENGTARSHQVLVCAGAWSGGIGGLPATLAPPVRPVKGQMLSVRPKFPPPHIIYTPGLYIIPRRDGHVLIGATVEEAGFDKSTENERARELLRVAATLWPAIADAKFEAHWSGLRPGTPDGLPILGETSIPNLFVATGHFRNGILLAPVTAQLIAERMTDSAEVSIDCHFAPSRFASTLQPCASH